MKVSVVGSGPIALGYAALLAQRGHGPVLWSPRQSLSNAVNGRLAIVTRGAFESTAEVAVSESAQQAAQPDVVVLCVRGNGYRAAMDALAPHLEPRHTVVISSHGSLGALYLSQQLAARALSVPILALPTTVLTASMGDGEVNVKALRGEIDVAAVPAVRLSAGLNLLKDLFGDVFVGAPDLLSTVLSNVNPQFHMAGVILNFTRMERGERWDVFGSITRSVGRLVEQLDEERLAIASAFGLKVRSARDHYLKSFSGLPPDGDVHTLAQSIAARRPTVTPGPTSLDTRWLTEDLPFGIVGTIALGRLVGVPTSLHDAGLEILSAAAGRDYRAEDDLLVSLRLDGMTPQRLQTVAREGWPLLDVASASVWA